MTTATAREVRVTVLRWDAPGWIGSGTRLERVEFVIHVPGRGLFSVVSAFAGQVADQVEKDLQSVTTELIDAAIAGDQRAITRIGRDAMTRALEALNPPVGR